MAGRDTETLLRDALHENTRGIRADTDFVNATLDHSVASLRSLRRRQAALGAGAVAAVVALVAWQVPQLADRADRGPTSHVKTVENAMTWAQSLPRGNDADVAYVDHDTLVDGSDRTLLDVGGQYTVLGALPGGWFADLRQPTGGPYANPDTYGYLDTGGRFHAFPPVGRLNVDGAAVSPDGRSVAYNGVIARTGLDDQGNFDPATAGTVTKVLPANARVIYDYTENGVVYRDSQNRFWQGQPSRTTPGWARMPVDDYLPGGYGVTHNGACDHIGRTAAGAAQWRLCDLGDPIAVSSGNYALMSDGEFVNLEQGVDFLTLPPSVRPEQLQVLWESDDSLILVASETEGGSTSATLVRCTVSAGLCERASDQLSSSPQISATSGSDR